MPGLNVAVIVDGLVGYCTLLILWISAINSVVLILLLWGVI